MWQAIKCFFGYHWPVTNRPIFDHEGGLSHVHKQCRSCFVAWDTWTDRDGRVRRVRDIYARKEH